MTKDSEKLLIGTTVHFSPVYKPRAATYRHLTAVMTLF